MASDGEVRGEREDSEREGKVGVREMGRKEGINEERRISGESGESVRIVVDL